MEHLHGAGQSLEHGLLRVPWSCQLGRSGLVTDSLRVAPSWGQLIAGNMRYVKLAVGLQGTLLSRGVSDARRVSRNPDVAVSD